MLDDRELEELFRARASTLPEPGPELFTRILARIAPDPPRRNPVTAWWRRLGLRTELAFAVATVLVFAVVGIGQFASGPLRVPEHGQLMRVMRMPTPPPAPQAIKVNSLNTTARTGGAMEAAPPGAPGQGPAIARSATIALLVRSVPAALTALDGIARGNGGLVTRLEDSVPAVAEQTRFAKLTVLVDARRLNAAMARIAALGAQQSRTTTAESVGEAIVDDRARLRNLRREETDLLRIMDRSGSVASILDVEAKLADVRGEIERLTAELAGTQHRVATAQIDVSLTEERVTVAPATPTLADHIDATWHAAQRSALALLASIVDLVLWLAAFAPFWIAAALIAATLVLRSRPRF